MKKTYILLAIICMALFANTAVAELKELDTAQDFEKLVQEAKVPVIVKFSAYW